MGCFGSKSAETKSEKGRALRRPVWNSEYPMTRSELQVHIESCRALYQQDSFAQLPFPLQQKREEFWDTAPHYGGDRGMFHAVWKRHDMATSL